MLHGIYEVPVQCWNWCSQQTLIHQSNLKIVDLSIIFIAIVSLFLHQLIHKKYYWIRNELDLSENFIAKLYDGTYYFSMVLMIIFILYQIYK